MENPGEISTVVDISGGDFYSGYEEVRKGSECTAQAYLPNLSCLKYSCNDRDSFFAARSIPSVLELADEPYTV